MKEMQCAASGKCTLPTALPSVLETTLGKSLEISVAGLRSTGKHDFSSQKSVPRFRIEVNQ